MLQFLTGMWVGSVAMGLVAFFATRRMARDASWVTVFRRDRARLLRLAYEVHDIAEDGKMPYGTEAHIETVLWAQRWSRQLTNENWWDEPNA